MGNAIGSDAQSGNEDDETEHNSNKSKKRRREDSGSGSPDKKLMKLNTPEFLYKKLFLEGHKSDVVINALDHTWYLHKIYLEQCNYFASLFEGKWKDANEKVYNLDIIDPNITYEGLNNVFASLYNNEIEIDIENVAGVISAAVMLNLESVIDRCGDVMCESLCDTNIIHFANLAEQYGLQNVAKTSFEHLKRNFWRISYDNEFLSSISQSILAKLLSTPEILVVEGEKDLYGVVKRWICLQYSPETIIDPNVNFKKFIEKIGAIFDRRKFVDILQSLRLAHLVTSCSTLNELRTDNLIPVSIIDKVLIDQWNVLLLNEESQALPEEISDEFFYSHCLRLGRRIDETPKCWRWSGFNFGLDILLNFNHGVLTLKRNCLSQSSPYSINIRPQATIHYRRVFIYMIIICSETGEMVFDSNKRVASLTIDQSIVVARTPVKLPISIHLLYLGNMPGPSSTHYWTNYLARRTETPLNDNTTSVT
uniref:BTB domain-containing protein n=1 Tax=Acrobeloides nanus TaxID=290746 RepID=A0A914BV57_9BILA